MGKLRDNTISGLLPTTHAFAVHYPGYPLSKRRAIETLGGTQSILKVLLLVGIKSLDTILKYLLFLYLFYFEEK